MARCSTQRSVFVLLLGSRLLRSPSNPALSILLRAFASAADAIQGIG